MNLSSLASPRPSQSIFRAGTLLEMDTLLGHDARFVIGSIPSSTLMSANILPTRSDRSIHPLVS